MARKRIIDRDMAVTAAIEMADAEGILALSLRALGERLGVTQAAFYRHLRDKDALIDAMCDAVWEEVSETARREVAEHPAPDWRSYAHMVALSLWDTLQRHPGMVSAMATRLFSTPRQYQLMAESMSWPGVPTPITQDALDLLAAEFAYTLGCAAAVLTFEADGRERLLSMDRALAEMVESPQLAETFSSWAHERGPGNGFQLSRGLQTLSESWPFENDDHCE